MELVGTQGALFMLSVHTAMDLFTHVRGNVLIPSDILKFAELVQNSLHLIFLNIN